MTTYKDIVAIGIENSINHYKSAQAREVLSNQKLMEKYFDHVSENGKRRLFHAARANEGYDFSFPCWARYFEAIVKNTKLVHFDSEHNTLYAAAIEQQLSYNDEDRQENIGKLRSTIESNKSKKKGAYLRDLVSSMIKHDFDYAVNLIDDDMRKNGYSYYIRTLFYTKLISLGLLDGERFLKIKRDTSSKVQYSAITSLFYHREMYEDKDYEDLLKKFFSVNDWSVKGYVVTVAPKKMLPYFMSTEISSVNDTIKRRLEE